jgi:hypothetical protein
LPVTVTRKRDIELHRQGADLSTAGHHEDVLRVDAEAVRLLRMPPGNTTVTKILVMTLGNMGLNFSALGHHEDALRVEGEVVQLGRKLSKTDPSINTHLALSLYWLGVKLQAADAMKRRWTLTRRQFAFVAACRRRTQPSSGICVFHWLVWP